MKFKVGDRVRIVTSCDPTLIGVTGTVTKVEKNLFSIGSNVFAIWDDDNIESFMYENQLERIEPMSLRERIEALDNGWDKKADDILNELQIPYDIRIKQDKYTDGQGYYPCGHLSVSTFGSEGKTFSWGDRDKKTPCDKNRAFKDALLWLLDKSGLEKPTVGSVVKAEIDGKVYKLKVLESL